MFFAIYIVLNTDLFKVNCICIIVMSISSFLQSVRFAFLMSSMIQIYNDQLSIKHKSVNSKDTGMQFFFSMHWLHITENTYKREDSYKKKDFFSSNLLKTDSRIISLISYFLVYFKHFTVKFSNLLQ